MTTPKWDLSIAYQGLGDSKIVQDIELIQQCINTLNLHAESRTSVSVMQNAIQTREAAGKLLATINTFAMCHASVDASNGEAKSLVGRLAKLSSELSQAFTPYQDALVSEPEAFIQQVLEHESDDVSGQYFYIHSERKLADTKLSIAEEQLLSALEVDGKDAWGRLYDNITGSM